MSDSWLMRIKDTREASKQSLVGLAHNLNMTADRLSLIEDGAKPSVIEMEALIGYRWYVDHA